MMEKMRKAIKTFNPYFEMWELEDYAPRILNEDHQEISSHTTTLPFLNRRGPLIIKHLQMLVDDEMHKDRFKVLRIVNDRLSDDPHKHANPLRFGGY